MKTLTATEGRKQLDHIVDNVADSHNPIQIEGKRNSVLLISGEDGQAVQETLCIIGISGMRKSIQKGLSLSVVECEKKIHW